MKKSFLLLFSFLYMGQLLAQHAKGMLPKGSMIPAGTERRLALVIGNKAYQYISPLKNPTNDALAMKAALDTLGFDVVMHLDLDRSALISAFNKFKNGLRANDVVFVYFSGHGVGYEGQSYILPTDADISCLEQIETHGVGLQRILTDLNAKQVKNIFVMLDACRNLPSLQACNASTKGIMVKGLIHPSNNPSGSTVVYATKEGKTADDNPNAKNGLFTECLLRYLTHPNWSIRTILDRTALDVKQVSRNSQEPARYEEGMYGDFFFLINENGGQPPVPPAPNPIKNDILPDEPIMVSITGGVFRMGSNEGDSDEKPVHLVQVSDFTISQSEISVQDFKAFVDEKNYITEAEKVGKSTVWNGAKWVEKVGVDWLCDALGNRRKPEEYNHPVLHVSWNDANAYCNWLKEKTGKAYRLPTEAEWEYAAGNGPTHTRFSWGDENPSAQVGNVADEQTRTKYRDWEIVANYNDGYVYTSPVGTYQENKLRLKDMTGNVWEWCSDWYDAKFYGQNVELNPQGAVAGKDRVLRGGSWYNALENSRIAKRHHEKPSYQSGSIGFRVCYHTK